MYKVFFFIMYLYIYIYIYTHYFVSFVLQRVTICLCLFQVILSYPCLAMRVDAYIYTYIYVYVYMYICIYVCISMHICISVSLGSKF